MMGKEFLGPAIIFLGIAAAGAGAAIQEDAPLPGIIKENKQPIGDVLFIAGTATAASLTFAELAFADRKQRQS